jgi:hypothetical protein
MARHYYVITYIHAEYNGGKRIDTYYDNYDADYWSLRNDIKFNDTP